MAAAIFCALGAVLQLIFPQNSLALPPSNVNSNQNNQMLSLVLQALANNNAQNTANTIPANNNEQRVANTIPARNNHQRVANTGTNIANLALAQSANQASLLSGLAAQTNPCQSMLSKSTNTALLRALLSKNCACGTASDQTASNIRTQGSVPLSTSNLPVSVVNQGNASSMPSTNTVTIPITISANDLSSLLNQNQQKMTIQSQPKLVTAAQSPCSIQNQPVLISSQNELANVMSNPCNGFNNQPPISLPQDQPQHLQVQPQHVQVQPQHVQAQPKHVQVQPQHVQAQPSFSLVLCPYAQNPTPSQQYLTGNTLSYYPPSKAPESQGSKKSGLKMLLPLLFDLLNDKDCGCQRNCNCGCCNNSCMPPQVNDGYANQMNYGKPDVHFTPDVEENEVVTSATLGQRKSKGNDTNEDFDDDVNTTEVYDSDD